MKTYLDCVPCFARQALLSARLVSDDEVLHEQVLREVLTEVAAMDLGQNPPVMGRQIHRVIRRVTKVADPYAALKRRFNQHAELLLPELLERVEAAGDPFEVAVRLAIAGNVIDFGVPGEVNEQCLADAIERCLDAPLDPAALHALRLAASRAETILLLADNAGEIVIDRLLLQQLAIIAPDAHLTVAVRGGPVINDATRIDAEAARIDELATIIDNGSDVPGTVLDECCTPFVRAFSDAEVVISKGQGNFETLNEAGRPLFFLFMAKCPVVARHVGREVGDIVLLAHNP